MLPSFVFAIPSLPLGKGAVVHELVSDTNAGEGFNIFELYNNEIYKSIRQQGNGNISKNIFVRI